MQIYVYIHGFCSFLTCWTCRRAEWTQKPMRHLMAPCLMCHLQLSVRTLAWKIYKFKCNWDLRPWGNKQFFVVGNWREGRETDGTKLGNIEYCEPIWRWWVDMPISFHIRMWNGVYNIILLAWGIFTRHHASCIKVTWDPVDSDDWRHMFIWEGYTALLQPLLFVVFVPLLRLLQMIA